MKLYYLTPLTYPARFGNRLQVMKMSAAFAQKADCVLVAAALRSPLRDIFKEYAIRNPFMVQEVGHARLLPRSFWQARRLLPIIAAAEHDSIFYTRDVLTAFWLLLFSERFYANYFFELHTLARFPRWMYRRVLSHARGVITTNAQKKDDMVHLFGIDSSRILVWGNGVDLAEFAVLSERADARRELGISTEKLLVVYAGTVAENYGARVIEEAQQILTGEVEIRVVSGEARSVALHSMAAADILIAPYLAADDHFRLYMSPIKIKEYMAAGRPMIVSDLPAVREMVDESCAFFAEPGSARSLADAIRFVMAHPDEAASRAKMARVRAESFTWEKRAEDIIQFIERYAA